MIQCATHSVAETGLACARCDTPVCARCVVTTIVGTRCRACAPQTGHRTMRAARQQAFADAAPFGLPVSGLVRFLLTGGIAAACIGLVAYSWVAGDHDRLIVRAVVYGGWIVSLVMHELAHGLVGYAGGDRDVKARGYLTLDPLKFMDPVWSIGIPLLFVMIGGRTFVDGHALKSRWWDTAVSLAGPATNLAVAMGIGMSFSLGLVDPVTTFGAGLAFLGLLQIVTAMFNLIPAPPLDGFGAIEPHLPPDTARQLRSLGFYGGYFLIIAVFWMVPGLGNFMWDQAWELSYNLDIPGFAAEWGRQMARF